ncbi:MAG: YraN family protein [Colwellia sp.]|nr:YraN family protein [Colwellia sp.]MCW8866088.1 YraN family protein [Colwellia sp.]MCW9080213.1 YraN family protein [Colwellia sp.]
MLWNNKSSTRATGAVTEQLAKQYLLQHGLTFIDENVHCRQGEIDLIMQDGATLVFVEVKYRKSDHFGGAIAAVSLAKQQKIKHCATFYLHKTNLNEYNTPCRFDVIALTGEINQPQVTWLKNAF